MRILLRVSSVILMVALGVSSAFAQNVYTGKGNATFRSEDGDWVGGGRNWSVTSSHGSWKGFLSDANADGLPDFVHVSFDASDAFANTVGSWWDWEFQASATKKNLAPGSFTGALRYPFNESSNGIDVTGDGRGCNTQKGTFIISSLVWDCLTVPTGNDLHLRKIVASFEQHCEGGDPALRGTITFTADAQQSCSGDTPGGGDPGGGGTPTPGDAFQLSVPEEFTSEPLVVANGTVTTIPVLTLTDGSFESDINLFATTDAQDFEDFRVELAPSTIPSPGVGATDLRVLTGPRTFPRTYQVTVTGLAGDRGASSTLLVTVTCDSPTILGTNQPKSISAANGSQVTLQVTPNGSGPFFYQWYKGVPGMTRNPVLAANESKLIFTTRETASYWVRVSNACGTADSNAATVTTTGSLSGPARRRGSGS